MESIKCVLLCGIIIVFLRAKTMGTFYINLLDLSDIIMICDLSVIFPLIQKLIANKPVLFNSNKESITIKELLVATSL